MQSMLMSYLILRAGQEDRSCHPAVANEDKVSKNINLPAQGYWALTEASCLDIHSYSANMYWVPTLLPSVLIDAENTKNVQMNPQKGGGN